MRPVGEPEPPGIRATEAGAGFFWIYAPVRFEDHALVTIVQERSNGERIMPTPPRLPPRVGTGARVVGAARARTPVRPRDTSGDRGHTFLLRGPARKEDAEIEVETQLAFPLLLGSGYGLEPDWKHGMYQGELVVQGQSVPPADPSYSTWALTEYAAETTYDGQVGYGMFEKSGDGTARQYGFTGWD